MKVYVKWAIRDESRQDDVMRCTRWDGIHDSGGDRDGSKGSQITKEAESRACGWRRW